MAESPKIPSYVEYIDHQLSPGDRAELRRWRPERPIEAAALWRGLVRFELKGAEATWALIFNAIAQTHGLGRSEPSLGRACAAAGISEARIIRLLNAPEAQQPDALLRIVAQLAAARQGFDVREFAAFARFPDESKRRRIARDFYSAQHTQEA